MKKTHFNNIYSKSSVPQGLGNSFDESLQILSQILKREKKDTSKLFWNKKKKEWHPQFW